MRHGLRGERLVALFILAWLAFHPPIVTLFGVNATVLGLPMLYLYLFAAWLLVIALTGLVVGRGDAGGPDGPGESARGDREG